MSLLSCPRRGEGLIVDPQRCSQMGYLLGGKDGGLVMRGRDESEDTDLSNLARRKSQTRPEVLCRSISSLHHLGPNPDPSISSNRSDGRLFMISNQPPKESDNKCEKCTHLHTYSSGILTICRGRTLLQGFKASNHTGAESLILEQRQIVCNGRARSAGYTLR